MKGLGSVIGIVILLLIVAASVALILYYFDSFQAVGAELSQGQISIYDHENEDLSISATAYYSEVSHSDCGVGIGSYHGKALGIYKYNLSNITITITNTGKVPSTITYIIITNGRGVQLFIYYVGRTIAPSETVNIIIYPQQLYSPYWPNWQGAPIAQYIPYQVVNDSCHNQVTPYYSVPVSSLTQFGNIYWASLSYQLSV
ncbi:hypothetical protein [Stygiolobus caldivivus]|uniref:Uncharacterized protein n=1 Tax=Stygiolobus caldivivus TaxID=2824673 RepID=A0A8D5U8F7_9CREN|nr:hypothetical protein [Stygiolobus caldivivus]BCU70940.1 hypothetical protein KN1_22370 [Stygiolobus caldivivus]